MDSSVNVVRAGNELPIISESTKGNITDIKKRRSEKLLNFEK